MPHPEIDLTGVRTVPLAVRGGRVRPEQLARTPPEGVAAAMLAALPDAFAARDLRQLVQAVVDARRAGRRVLVMLGGHVIKVGVAPCLLALAREGLITAFAMNGAAAIHDSELALCGATSEDVQAALLDGTFGFAAETGEFVNRATSDGARQGWGLGEALGHALVEAAAPYGDTSLLATAYRLGLPCTVHVALGTDIVHQHPQARGEDIGATSLRDFRILAHHVSGLHRGVVLNLGSAVILPEVFLKTLAIARNLGHEVSALTTANFDMLRHYRPQMNVVQRPTYPDGIGISLTGPHEILLPLFAGAVLDAWRTSAPPMRSALTFRVG